ncbi:MAG: hypothetical protein ACOC3I_02460 [Verrucomicrobiota bacterium]
MKSIQRHRTRTPARRWFDGGKKVRLAERSAQVGSRPVSAEKDRRRVDGEDPVRGTSFDAARGIHILNADGDVGAPGITPDKSGIA